MAPGLLRRIFRREEKDPDPTPRVGSPESPGILDSSCIVMKNPSDKKSQQQFKLPIPRPEQRQRELKKLSTHAQPQHSQHQSAFFKLPLEVRIIIYEILFGGRRVHIEYAWRSDSDFRPAPKNGKEAKELQRKHWQWWHRVCQISDHWVDDRNQEFCPSHSEEGYEARCNFEWHCHDPPPEGTKLQGVDMLMTCQMGYYECLPVLYGSNTFVTGPNMDTPFIMSRLLAPSYAARIRKMDIAIDFHLSQENPLDLSQNWSPAYYDFFDILSRSFPNVRYLHLTFTVFPLFNNRIKPTEETLYYFMSPWEYLSGSRVWAELSFSVPEDCYALFEDRAGVQRCWTLKSTQIESRIERALERSTVTCFGMGGNPGGLLDD